MAATATSDPIKRIVAEMIAHVSDDAAYDLRFEDAAAAAERHFSPLRTKALQRANFVSADCSIDGWYDVNIDAERPWILYSKDQGIRRVRFTMAHELGHHLLQSSASVLLDDLDELATSPDELNALEESVCHQFAGALLVPDSHLSDVIGESQIVPAHVLELYHHGAASLEAIAVRVAGIMSRPGAVVIMGSDCAIGFCASSPALGKRWWNRGDLVDPSGPLSRATIGEIRATPETYRYGLAYSCQLYCDTLAVTDTLGIAVLCDQPSTNTRAVLAETEPRWKDDVQMCAWCLTAERDVGWCQQCKGKRCRKCDKCGCIAPNDDPACPVCRLRNPRRAGAVVCRDCE